MRRKEKKENQKEGKEKREQGKDRQQKQKFVLEIRGKSADLVIVSERVIVGRTADQETTSDHCNSSPPSRAMRRRERWGRGFFGSVRGVAGLRGRGGKGEAGLMTI